MSRCLTLLLLVSLFFIAPARSQDADDAKPVRKNTLMDDPHDQGRLTREIWESTKSMPYSKALAYAYSAQEKSKATAAASSTVTLPTGWSITPAGTQVSVGNLPFDALAFNGSVVVVDSGYSAGPQDFKVIDPAAAQVTQTISIQNVFPAATVGPGGSLYISGGFSKQAYRYNSQFALTATYNLPGTAHGLAGYDSRYLVATYTNPPFAGGIASTAHVVMIDTTTGNITRDSIIGLNEPYQLTVIAGKIYVLVPASNQVVVLDNNLNTIATLNVGTSPESSCQDGLNLYVVDSNSDDVAVVNTTMDQVVASFPVKFWNQKWGAGPTSCAVDGNTLYVTLSQANAVAVLDKGTGGFQGYIPTGWYPTKVVSLAQQLVILSAKGIRPLRPTTQPGADILNLLQGSAGLLAKSAIAPNLFEWTLQVAASAPYILLPSIPSAMIKHAFFIVKENRTYDQILGDLGKGNGDPTLVNFGNAVTPIQHYLANAFITFDNLYVDGEVSTTGHSITASSYASPYLQLITSLDYSDRLDANSSFVAGGFSPTYIWDVLAAGNIGYRVYGEAVYFQSLYLLGVKYFGPQSALAASLRALSNPQTSQSVATQLTNLFASHISQTSNASSLAALLKDPQFGPSLSQVLTGGNTLYQSIETNGNFFADLVNFFLHYQFNYSVFDLNVSDLDRAAAWIQDFQFKDALGLVEPFHYITLPNDHTGGNTLGLTPVQQVAENDAALDIILRTLVKSRIWSQSIVFVIEDDAQSGLDHVDGTRTTGFVVSPWVKHGVVISDRFDQLSMVRTIGMLLGANPISMNDALATPMFSIFTPPFSAPILDYNPPSVSTMLSATDLQKYNQLLAALNAQP